MIKTLQAANGLQFYFLGPDPEVGRLPAFFYFALSGEESLTLHPYNYPAQFLESPHYRIFSLTIPGHGEGMNKFHAMQYWAEQMHSQIPLLQDFFELGVEAIAWLIDQQIVDPHRMAAGGLSRGGFIATHFAARLLPIQTLLGFSPLTDLNRLKEFEAMGSIKAQAAQLDLISCIDHLSHVKNIRFYIGNLDSRVGTDACYHFIRALAEKGHEKRIRNQKIELMITQSIGHKGHGTDPKIFEEGSLWVKSLLIGQH